MNLIKDLGMRKTLTAKHPVRFGLYECTICKNHFEARTANIRSGNTKSCGCAQYPKPDQLRQTSMYSSWDHMKQRCLNPKNDNFHHYGGRGILLCDEWLDFKEFSKWALTNGWSSGLTIDRKDPNGNYEPTNCRWTNQTVQARNTRNLQSNNTSGYRGVTEVKLSNDCSKWRSEIMVDYTMHRLGRFNTKLEAAQAYDRFVLINNLEHTINGVLTDSELKEQSNGKSNQVNI